MTSGSYVCLVEKYTAKHNTHTHHCRAYQINEKEK